MDDWQERLNYGFDEFSEPPLTLEFIQNSFTIAHFFRSTWNWSTPSASNTSYQTYPYVSTTPLACVLGSEFETWHYACSQLSEYPLAHASVPVHLTKPHVANYQNIGVLNSDNLVVSAIERSNTTTSFCESGDCGQIRVEKILQLIALKKCYASIDLNSFARFATAFRFSQQISKYRTRWTSLLLPASRDNAETVVHPPE